ncbi:MAG TPA: TIGR02587 family membrane protein [Fimbriimonas sp.]
MAKEQGQRDARRSPTIRQSLQEYGRGIVGGLLFSLPLLYTMEVWWTGFIASPMRLIAALGGTFLLLLGYNRFAGLRKDSRFSEVAIDSLEELGLGLALSAFVLWALGRINWQMPPEEFVGKIVVEALLVAIGVSVGTAQLGDAEDSDDHGMGEDRDEPGFWGNLVLAVCGAVLVGANVAPTEEVVRLAIENSSLRLLALVLVSLVLTGVILHYLEFRHGKALPAEGRFRTVVVETGIAYAAALVVSAVTLAFFNRFDGVSSIIAVALIVVLALPATLGASAGRLLLRG